MPKCHDIAEILLKLAVNTNQSTDMCKHKEEIAMNNIKVKLTKQDPRI